MLRTLGHWYALPLALHGFIGARDLLSPTREDLHTLAYKAHRRGNGGGGGKLHAYTNE